MKLVIHIVILSLAALVVLGGILFVVIDMFTRVDYLRDKFSWLEKALGWRGSLTALVLVATFLLIGDGYELIVKEAPEIPHPPTMIVKAPLAPTVYRRGLPPSKEPKNSLRRRTMQLADEIEKYILGRASDPNRPPFAVPNSNDPNPSGDQKRAIERYRKYEQETLDYYFAHYRDRMIGVIKEYDAKGIKTGYLESGARQRPPIFIMPGSVGEGTYMDDLYQFRELAYHVDGEGNLIVITP